MKQRIFYPNKLKKIILVAFNLKTTYFSGQSNEIGRFNLRKNTIKYVVLKILSIWKNLERQKKRQKNN